MPTRKPPRNDAQLELFSAVFTDIASRDTHDTLEYPFLSLSVKPRFEPITYEGTNGVDVIVSGGKPYGIANIFDWDLMIWLISQIRQGADNGLTVSRKVRFSRYGYLKDVRRGQSGREYQRLATTIARLKNTMVTTNLRAKNGKSVMFNWFEYVEIEKDKNGAPSFVTVILPEWLFDAVCDHRLVLNLNRDYFLLKGGIERWLYRIVRKAAGKSSWQWKLKTLHERSGSPRPYKFFAHDVRKIVSRKNLLDYELSIFKKDGKAFLKAEHRAQIESEVVQQKRKSPTTLNFLGLRTETYEKAKRAAPGFDVYAIEVEWREFNERKQTEIKRPDKAFVAFCKTYAANNPIPAR